MATFYDMIYYLQEVGIADVLLPFLLIFVLAFAILQKVKVLGEGSDGKRYNMIVALVMGLAVVIPHIVWGTPDPNNPYLITGMVDPVKVINNSLPSVSVVLVAILLVMLLLGIFGMKFSSASNLNVGIMVFSVLTVGYIFLTNAGLIGGGRYPQWLWFLADRGTQSMLIVILVFGVIVWFITKDEAKPKQPGERWRDYLVPIKDKDHE